jgi:hypothetical protein
MDGWVDRWIDGRMDGWMDKGLASDDFLSLNNPDLNLSQGTLHPGLRSEKAFLTTRTSGMGRRARRRRRSQRRQRVKDLHFKRLNI